MKTLLLLQLTATVLMHGTVYALSVIVSAEMVKLIAVLSLFAFLRFIIRVTLSAIFQVLKWVVIAVVIGGILAS